MLLVLIIRLIFETNILRVSPVKQFCTWLYCGSILRGKGLKYLFQKTVDESMVCPLIFKCETNVIKFLHLILGRGFLPGGPFCIFFYLCRFISLMNHSFQFNYMNNTITNTILIIPREWQNFIVGFALCDCPTLDSVIVKVKLPFIIISITDQLKYISISPKLSALHKKFDLQYKLKYHYQN